MILDTIENAGLYKSLSPAFNKAFEILETADFSELADGRYEVDGDRLFYSVMSFTAQGDNSRAEAHKRYIDIQYIISGHETIAYAPLSAVKEIEQNPDGDIWLYEGKFCKMELSSGSFAVYFPNDAHSPGGMGQNGAQAVRKCVVKILIY